MKCLRNDFTSANVSKLTASIFLVWLLSVHTASNGMTNEMVKECANAYPPTTALSLQVATTLGLAKALYDTINRGNFFRGNGVEESARKIVFWTSSLALLSVIFVKQYQKKCGRLLFMPRLLPHEQESVIRMTAQELALFDCLISMALLLQYSNMLWHYTKVLKPTPLAIPSDAYCPICKEPHIDPVNPCRYSVKHVFCKKCIEQSYLQNQGCPLCRVRLAEQFPQRLKDMLTSWKKLNWETRRQFAQAISGILMFFALHIFAAHRLYTYSR